MTLDVKVETKRKQPNADNKTFRKGHKMSKNNRISKGTE